MTIRTDDDLGDSGPLGVAEAKRRFSELIDRVGEGERFVVSRHGSPAVMLGPPSDQKMLGASAKPIGLAAIAGALAEWDDIDGAIEEIYAARRRSRDRPTPDLG